MGSTSSRLKGTVRGNRGFTLLEAAIASIIGLLVILLASTYFLGAGKMSTYALQQYDAQEKSRKVFSEIVDGRKNDRTGLRQATSFDISPDNTSIAYRVIPIEVQTDGSFVEGSPVTEGYWWEPDTGSLYRVSNLLSVTAPTSGGVKVLEYVENFQAQEINGGLVQIRLETSVPSGTGMQVGTTCETVLRPNPLGSLPSPSLAGSHASAANVNLSWLWSESEAALGYDVERRTGDTPFTIITTSNTPGLAHTVSSYTDTVPALGKDYYYRVIGYSASGFASYSNVVRIPCPLAEPVPESAATSVDGKYVDVLINQAMLDPSGKEGEFTATVNGATRTFIASTLASNPSIIRLEVSGPAITNSDIVTVSYTAGTVKAASDKLLTGFINLPVTNLVPGPNPVVTGAATNTDGTIIKITFNKEMSDPSGRQEEFTATVNGQARTFVAAALDGSNSAVINLTLSDRIHYGDTVTVDYSAGTVSSDDGGALASFSGRIVTNNLPAPPTFVSAVTSGNKQITVTFSKPLANPSGKQNQFSAKVGSSTLAFSSATLGPGNTIVLSTSASEFKKNNTITLSYTAGTIVATDGGVLGSFNGQPVTNTL